MNATILAAGFCGLPIHQQRRLLLGLSKLEQLGRRAKAEFLVSVVHDRPDLEEVLHRLDKMVAQITPEMVAETSGDRFPPHRLREAPR